MGRSQYLLALLLLLITIAGCAGRQLPPDRPVKIGALVMGDSRTAKTDGMREGLQELGWTGDRISYLIYNAKDDEKKLQADAQDLLAQNPDIVAVTGAIEAEAVVRELRGKTPIPVVMIGVTSPLELKSAFADLGVPVTGVDNGHVELTGKRMELLRLLFPERHRLLLLYDPRLRVSLLALERAREAARTSSWLIEPVPVSSDQDLATLSQRPFSGQESMLTLPSYFLEAKAREIRDISWRKGAPVLGLYQTEAEAGYTGSYGISYYDQGYQAARLVLRTLQSRAGDIPFEMPDSVQLILNTKAAEKIGVTFSPTGLTYGEKIHTIRE